MKLKEVFSNIDTYVMCSTLNQIVNYIPLKLLEKHNNNEDIEIFNITMKNKAEEKSVFKRFDNKKWDENLKDVLDGEDIKLNLIYNKENYIFMDRNKLNISKKINNKLGLENDNEEDGIDDLKISCDDSDKDRTILWNLTGGQRSTIFAIQEYIRKKERFEDGIIYLEGNSNKIVYGKLKDDSSFEYALVDESYEIEDINLQKTFKLAGFEIRDYEGKINLLKETFKAKKKDEKKPDKQKHYEFCKKLYKYYKDKNSEIGKCLVKNLPILNKKKDEAKNNITNKEKIDKLWQELEKANVKGIFTEKEVKDILHEIKGGNQNKFGYILEYMTLFSIIDILKNIDKENYFIELIHSANVDKSSNFFQEKNTYELCEFDIVLLSKSGQVVFFECKSGTVNSDTGKARNYTAYAVGGVYGKPILITPLLTDDLNYINEVFREHINVKDGVLSKYEPAVFSAVRAAARANLEIWGIDEIEKRLKELYYEAMEEGDGRKNE